MRNIIRGTKVTWIDIRGPAKEDVQFLKNRYHFHPLVLEELVTPSHRP